jgi:hypothetical protein
MPRGIALAVLLSGLTAPGSLAASGAARAGAAALQAHASQPPAAVPDRSVSGVVKVVDRTSLVITRAGKTPVEMTFGVNASTVREGLIAVGTRVQVRFRDGHPAIATGIFAMPAARHAGRRSATGA